MLEQVRHLGILEFSEHAMCAAALATVSNQARVTPHGLGSRAWHRRGTAQDRIGETNPGFDATRSRLDTLDLKRARHARYRSTRRRRTECEPR